jgi:hypothetical protein
MVPWAIAMDLLNGISNKKISYSIQQKSFTNSVNSYKITPQFGM